MKRFERSLRRGTLAAIAFGAVLLLGALPLRAADVLVLEFELNDLTLYPNVEQEEARVASLRPLLLEALDEAGSVNVVPLPDEAALEAARGVGYLFDRPMVAARLGQRSGADWVVSGRLHKASHLFVYLKAQLVDAADGRVAADFVVEIKGWGERLTRRGVDTLAVQIVQSLDTLGANPGDADGEGAGRGGEDREATSGDGTEGNSVDGG